MPTKLSASFAAVQGKTPFDWRAFLNKPVKSDDEWNNAAELAARWTTCSCGIQHKAIPREVTDDGANGAPLDVILQTLGGSSDGYFVKAVRAKDAQKALDLLDLIDMRAAQVLRDTRIAAQKKLAEVKATLKSLED